MYLVQNMRRRKNMKMRKKLAALLAAAMIASVMPMSAFADSTNRVDKVITIAKDATIGVNVAPELEIEMKDTLTTGLSFYLNLTGAEWVGLDNKNEFKKDADGNDTTDLTDDSERDIYKALEELGYNPSLIAKDGTVLVAGADHDGKLSTIRFTVKNGNREVVFEAYRENNSRMAIRHISNTTNNRYPNFGEANEAFIKGDILRFPLVAKITGDDAKVEVEKHDTEVTQTEHLFAVSNAAKAKATVGSVPNFHRTATIADITIEELYANAVKGLPSDERWFTIELRDTDFTFAPIDKDAKIVGEKAYRGNEFDLAEKYASGKNDANGNPILAPIYTLSNDHTKLGIRIPAVSGARERGNFLLKGVKIIASRDARNGEVKATIDGKELFGKEIVTIANRGDYKTKLDVPKDWKKEVVAGNEKEVEFILSEELANSLVGRRPVTFTFDQGVKIKTNVTKGSKDWNNDRADYILWGANEAQLDSLIDAIDNAVGQVALAKAQANFYKYVYGYSNGNVTRPGESEIKVNKDIISVKGDDVTDKGEWDAELSRVHIDKDRQSFTVDFFEVIQDKAGKYTFKTTLLVPANVTGDIKLAVSGSGVTEEEITILEAEAPVTVSTTGMDIKVGLKEIQTTGKITIKETAKERIAQGKNIVLDIDEIDSGLKIKSFKATVVEGDLVLEDRKDTDGAIFGVKRVSTEPSTIEITDIVMSTDRTVPEGKYDLVIGGNAISSITARPEFVKVKHANIDPVVVVKDFINITTKNTEDLQGSANKAEVNFVVGSDQYTINGKVETMDAPPYIKDGRTMVSIKYVAQALGVDADKVIWDQANQTATIIADKVVQVKLGNKAMIVNGVSLPMEVAAELTNDRTFVPMGSIARALGVVVEWDETTKAVTFNPKTK